MEASDEETIVITGASRGIGAATARVLARPGRRLLLVARSEERLAQVCDEVERSGAAADYLKADLSSIELASDAAAKINERVDHIDTLVLNSGMSNNKMFEETTLDEVVYELGVNYLAPVTLLHTLLPHLKRSRGHAVVVGSLTSVLPFPANATYSASKATLLALIRSLRVELEDTGVHFGIVLPGFTDTAATRGMNSPMPRASPRKVAETIEQCIEERKGLVIPGAANRVAAALFQQVPGLAEKLLGPIKYKIFPGFDGSSE